MDKKNDEYFTPHPHINRYYNTATVQDSINSVLLIMSTSFILLELLLKNHDIIIKGDIVFRYLILMAHSRRNLDTMGLSHVE